MFDDQMVETGVCTDISRHKNKLWEGGPNVMEQGILLDEKFFQPLASGSGTKNSIKSDCHDVQDTGIFIKKRVYQKTHLW